VVPIRAAKARAELNREQVRGCPMKHPFVLLFAVASFVAVNTARADDNGKREMRFRSAVNRVT